MTLTLSQVVFEILVVFFFWGLVTEMLRRVLMLCGVATALQVSAAKPPAMWFWGSGSDESVSDF